MRKIIVIIFALLFVVIAIELGIIYFSSKKTSVKSFPVKIGGLTFVTTSEISGVALKIIDKDGLENYLNEKGILQNLINEGAAVLGEGQIQFPKTIEISLASQPQSFLKLVSLDEKKQKLEVRSVGNVWNETTKTYQLKVYFNQEAINQIMKDKTVETFTTDVVLQALYLISTPKLPAEEKANNLESMDKEIISRNLKFFTIK